MPRTRSSEDIRLKCYLCGKKPEHKTKEHIIPRHIFSPNSIYNPLILTACRKCNQDKKQDDEYTAVILQSTSESKDSFEAFDKTLASAKKALSPIAIPKHFKKPGAGLVMALKKNTTDMPILKRGDLYTHFNGGQVKLDVQRLNKAFTNMAKGIIVDTSGSFYDWEEFEFKVQFDQADYPQISHILLEPFKFTCQNAQFAEQWEQALFIAGLNHKMKSGYASSFIAMSFFDKFIVIVTMLHSQDAKRVSEIS